MGGGGGKGGRESVLCLVCDCVNVCVCVFVCVILLGPPALWLFLVYFIECNFGCMSHAWMHVTCVLVWLCAFTFATRIPALCVCSCVCLRFLIHAMSVPGAVQ